jgi:hypothetical protein
VWFGLLGVLQNNAHHPPHPSVLGRHPASPPAPSLPLTSLSHPHHHPWRACSTYCKTSNSVSGLVSRIWYRILLDQSELPISKSKRPTRRETDRIAIVE